MSLDFNGVADDFFVNLNLQTTLPLPTGRETILHFFEAVQKQFGTMRSFYQRDSGEYVLEGDREAGDYQWVEVQPRRLVAGYFNPPDVHEAYRLHRWLLDRSVYFLGVSSLDVEWLDLLFGFNLDFRGNRDEIVARALLSGSPLGAIVAEAPGKALECEPSVVIALDDDCCYQARLSIETRNNSYQVRTGQYDDEPISVYVTVRRYASPPKLVDVKESFSRQCDFCEDIACRAVLPQIIQPIAAAIAAGR